MKHIIYCEIPIISLCLSIFGRTFATDHPTYQYNIIVQVQLALSLSLSLSLDGHLQWTTGPSEYIITQNHATCQCPIKQSSGLGNINTYIQIQTNACTHIHINFEHLLDQLLDWIQMEIDASKTIITSLNFLAHVCSMYVCKRPEMFK